MKAVWRAFITDSTAEWATFLADKRSDFDVWFSTIQGILSGDVAGNLASEIAALKQRMTNVETRVSGHDIAIAAISSKTVETLTHTKVGTIHNLVGTIPETGYITAKFKADSDHVEGDTYTLNGTPFTAKPNGEELTLPDKAFVTGDVVSIEIDVVGKKLNFKSGGGTKVPSIFGDGSDGDLIIKAGETVTLPVEHPNKDIIIKQYKSILIETGGTLTTSAPNCGLVLRCKGDCTIKGTIDQSGKGGFSDYENKYPYALIMCEAVKEVLEEQITLLEDLVVLLVSEEFMAVGYLVRGEVRALVIITMPLVN